MDLERPTKFGRRLRSSGSGSHQGNAADNGVIRRFPSAATGLGSADFRRRLRGRNGSRRRKTADKTRDSVWPVRNRAAPTVREWSSSRPTKVGQRLRSDGSGSHRGNAVDHGGIRRFPSAATGLGFADFHRRLPGSALGDGLSATTGLCLSLFRQRPARASAILGAGRSLRLSVPLLRVSGSFFLTGALGRAASGGGPLRSLGAEGDELCTCARAQVVARRFLQARDFWLTIIAVFFNPPRPFSRLGKCPGRGLWWSADKDWA